MSIQRDLPDLVRAHFSSVWALELLLLMRRNADRSWSVEEVTDELRAALALVSTNLDRFERAGLVTRDDGGRFRYAPASPLLVDFVETVEHQYRERPVALINLIVAPEDRLQQLADAFRLRGTDRK